ncbi:hypothetical protein B0H14DRAFT_2964613, partial [Mycena olivaceomarginata]
HPASVNGKAPRFCEWEGPRIFPLDPRARAGQKFEILTRKPTPQPDKNEGLEPGYLGQVSGQKREAGSILRLSRRLPCEKVYQLGIQIQSSFFTSPRRLLRECGRSRRHRGTLHSIRLDWEEEGFHKRPTCRRHSGQKCRIQASCASHGDDAPRDAPRPIAVKSCPGVTEDDIPNVQKYLQRTGALGGGSQSVFKIAMERFHEAFSALTEKRQKEVRDIQYHEQKWRNDHANLRIFSTACEKMVPQLNCFGGEKRKQPREGSRTMMMARIRSKYISHISRGFEQHENAIHDMLQAPRSHIHVLE